jgi:hypothetical protein
MHIGDLALTVLDLGLPGAQAAERLRTAISGIIENQFDSAHQFPVAPPRLAFSA